MRSIHLPRLSRRGKIIRNLALAAAVVLSLWVGTERGPWTANGALRQLEQELLLEPGGDHIMLMDLAEPLLPGDEVELTLLFEDGTEHPYTATVKDFTGAQEHYEPEGGTGSGASDHGGHE